MKYALIADVHANVQALTTVLHYLDSQHIDRLVCLGDLVGYCAQPNRCVDLLRERHALCITGNHDRVAAGMADPVDFCDWARRAALWTRGQLTPENREFLQQLPVTANLDERTILVHASLHPKPNEHVRLRGLPEAQQTFAAMHEQFPQVNLCFFGHTHHAVAYESRNGQVTAVAGEHLQLRDEAHYLINPGSVGMTRDRTHLAKFLMYDSQARTVQFAALPHAWEACYQQALKAGITHRRSLARRLKDRWANLMGR